MKLSTKGKYGLRAMYYLAADDGKMLNLKQLSALSGVNEPYLEKLLGLLRKNGLIETVRGASGGYKLAHLPKDIKIGSILTALGDGLYFAACNTGNCSNKKCPSKDIFNKLYLKINKVLDEFSLSDMVKGELDE